MKLDVHRLTLLLIYINKRNLIVSKYFENGKSPHTMVSYKVC